MAHPIPKDALDDRMAFVGTAGDGKTPNAGSYVERLLDWRAIQNMAANFETRFAR